MSILGLLRPESRLVRVLFVADVAAFLAGILVGVVLGVTGTLPSVATDVASPYTFSELTVAGVVRNNLLVTAGLVVLTVTGFWIGTALFLFVNGFALGAQVAATLAGGTAVTAVLAAVLPHGPLEILGLSFAGAVGFRIPLTVWRYLSGSRDRMPDRSVFVGVLVRLLIAVGVVVLAAVIEVVVSLRLARILV